MDQKVVHYGPFVADCEENIEHAIIDYQYAQNGFENRKTWKTLISDGVTKDMIEGPLDGNLDKRSNQEIIFGIQTIIVSTSPGESYFIYIGNIVYNTIYVKIL